MVQMYIGVCVCGGVRFNIFIYKRISNGLKQQLDLKTSVESSLDPSHDFYMISSLLRVRATGVILRRKFHYRPSSRIAAPWRLPTITPVLWQLKYILWTCQDPSGASVVSLHSPYSNSGASIQSSKLIHAMSDIVNLNGSIWSVVSENSGI